MYVCDIPLLSIHSHRLPDVCQCQLIWRMTVTLRGSPRSLHNNICTLVGKCVPSALLCEQIEDRNLIFIILVLILERNLLFSPLIGIQWTSIVCHSFVL